MMTPTVRQATGPSDAFLVLTNAPREVFSFDSRLPAKVMRLPARFAPRNS